jgi:hypothetical protein
MCVPWNLPNWRWRNYGKHVGYRAARPLAIMPEHSLAHFPARAVFAPVLPKNPAWKKACSTASPA